MLLSVVFEILQVTSWRDESSVKVKCRCFHLDKTVIHASTSTSQIEGEIFLLPKKIGERFKTLRRLHVFTTEKWCFSNHNQNHKVSNPTISENTSSVSFDDDLCFSTIFFIENSSWDLIKQDLHCEN